MNLVGFPPPLGSGLCATSGGESKATKNIKKSDNCELTVMMKDYLLIIFGELPGLAESGVLHLSIIHE